MGCPPVIIIVYKSIIRKRQRKVLKETGSCANTKQARKKVSGVYELSYVMCFTQPEFLLKFNVNLSNAFGIVY